MPLCTEVAKDRLHSFMKRRTRIWLRFALVVLLGGALYLLMRDYEQQFVYAPTSLVKKTPRDAGMAFDSVALLSADGVTIQGWFVPAQPSPVPASTNDPAAPLTVLCFHGRRGNLSDSLDKVHLFHDIGLDVFAIDYHGFGASSGTPDENALAGDAMSAYFYAVDKRGVKPERLYIFGEDLGAAVAIDLATRVAPAGLILEGANASILEKIEDDWPLIPWQYLLRNQFDSIKKIGDVRTRLLMFHSSDDELVPFNDARRLYALAHEPKELVELHGSHRDAFVKSFETYYDKIDQFVHGGPKGKSGEAVASTPSNATASKEPTP
jgi:alpha-beta hydrolase superfamily lysophospholipase